MITRVIEKQLDIPSLASLIKEIEEARGEELTLKDRLDSIAGSVNNRVNDLEFKNAINIAKTNFRLSSHMEATRQNLVGLIVDTFNDTSGIDDGMSRLYGYDSEKKEVHALTEMVWEEVHTEDRPPARSGHSLVFDSNRGVVVLFGGSVGSTHLDDTWEYDGTNWVQINTPTKPPARRWHSLAFDSIRGRFVLFGGSSGNYNRINDTWEYDGTKWVQINAPTKPPARYGHSLVFDSNRGVIVLFGGFGDHGSLNDTWEYDGTNWRRINTPTQPPARDTHSLTYDSTRGVVVLFGGWEFGGWDGLNDTWEYDGANWVQIDTPTKPPARYNHSLAYDSIRGRVVLFGGRQDSSSYLNDTWEYDGTNWVQINAPRNPSARYSHSLTFDSIRGRAVLFGGWDGSRLNDTWEYWDSIDPAEVISSPDVLESNPSKIYFVPHIPDGATASGIEYHLSLDGGANWFPIQPEELMPVPDEALISDPPVIRVKAIIPSGRRLSGWAYGWM